MIMAWTARDMRYLDGMLLAMKRSWTDVDIGSRLWGRQATTRHATPQKIKQPLAFHGNLTTTTPGVFNIVKKAELTLVQKLKKH